MAWRASTRARETVLELEEAAQERLLRRRESCHVGRTLAAAQDRAQRDEKQFVQTGRHIRLAGPSVLTKQAKNCSNPAASGSCGSAEGKSIAFASSRRRLVCQGNSKCDCLGLGDSQRLRTSTCPSEGCGTSVAVQRNSAPVSGPSGRALKSHWRFFAPVMMSSPGYAVASLWSIDDGGKHPGGFPCRLRISVK